MNETMEQYKYRILSTSSLSQLCELYRLAARECFICREAREDMDLIGKFLYKKLEAKKLRRTTYVWSK